MISAVSFWSGLLAAVCLALGVEVACLAYLWRHAPALSDRAVVTMLRRIAIFNAIPLLWFASYFSVRIIFYETDAARSIGIVAYASIGYLLALVAIILPAITSAVLVYQRSRNNSR